MKNANVKNYFSQICKVRKVYVNVSKKQISEIYAKKEAD